MTEQEKKTKSEKKEPENTLYGMVKANPIRQIAKLIAITENAMQERITVWDRYRRKYRRGIYYLRNLSNGVPLYFTNYVYSTVESVKSNMTRNLPNITCAPRGRRDDFAADVMSSVLTDSLLRGGLKPAVRTVVHHGLISTLAYFKTFYNDLTGNIEVCGIAPDDLLVDPAAYSIKDARWVIHRRRNVPTDEIYAMYGSIPSKDADKDDERSDDSSHVEDNGLYVSEGELRDAVNVAPVFDVYECWIRCWDTDRENDYYVVTIAGDTVLSEDFSPYKHNKTPFVEWVAVEDYAADNIYHRGSGYIEEIEPLQDRVDALDLKLYKNVSLLSNRQRYVSAQSGLNINAMDNTAGRSYKVNGDPQKAVYYDAPPQMSAQTYEYRDRTEMLIQTVSGVFDVTMGRRPTGITAGRAIDSLKDSAETRLANVNDTLAEAIEEVSGLSLQNILQFYDGDRIVKSVDGDKDIEFLVVSDYPQELQPTPEVQIDAFGFPLTDDNGEAVLVDDDAEPEVTPELEKAREEWKKQAGVALVLSDVTYEWDIRASTDSALPSARAERAQVAADLFRLGAIDREAVLESMDFPNRHKILSRLANAATGKNAGDPNVDTTNSQVEQIFAMLQQMGIPQEVLDQILAQVQQDSAQPQGGNFPPQMTM
jgi:hypothetical protein